MQKIDGEALTVEFRTANLTVAASSASFSYGSSLVQPDSGIVRARP